MRNVLAIQRLFTPGTPDRKPVLHCTDLCICLVACCQLQASRESVMAGLQMSEKSLCTLHHPFGRSDRPRGLSSVAGKHLLVQNSAAEEMTGFSVQRTEFPSHRGLRPGTRIVHLRLSCELRPKLFDRYLQRL